MPRNRVPAKCTVRLTVRVMTGAWLGLLMGPHWSQIWVWSLLCQPLPTPAPDTLSLSTYSASYHTKHVIIANISSLNPHQAHNQCQLTQPHGTPNAVPVTMLIMPELDKQNYCQHNQPQVTSKTPQLPKFRGTNHQLSENKVSTA